MVEQLISIIVPAYNAEKTIKQCIEALINIDYTNYEIIIVDDGSVDKTKEILSEFKNRIKIIESQHFGPSKCRNIAALGAKGEYVAFTDSDCIVDKNWLSELLKGFIDDKVASVGGGQLSPQDETEFGKRVQMFFELTGFLGGYFKQTTNYKLQTTNQNVQSRIIKVNHNPSCNSMYRKKEFLEIGGFDENLWPSEDVDLDYRLKKQGFKFMYNPNAIVYHYRPQSLSQLSKMMYRYGVMQGILTKRYGFFRAIQFIPILLVFYIASVLYCKNLFWLIPIVLLVLFLKIKHIGAWLHIILLIITSLISWSYGLLTGILNFLLH